MPSTIALTLSLAFAFGVGAAAESAPVQPAAPTGPAQATVGHLEDLERELEALDAEVAARREAGKDPLDPGLASRSRELHDEAIYLKVKSRKHAAAGGEGTGVTADEVASLREAIAKLRDDIRLSDSTMPEAQAEAESENEAQAEGAAKSTAKDEVVDMAELPADTVFSARLLDSLTSETAEVGDRFEAVTVLPVTLDGRTIIPENSSVFGAVESVDRAGRTDRTAKLVLAFDRLDIEGDTHTITATVVGASRDLETGLGKEKKKMGLGAGVGGVIGAVLGGGTGAIAGAILGGTGAILGTEGRNVDLPRGTMLQLRLDRPLRLRPQLPSP